MELQVFSPTTGLQNVSVRKEDHQSVTTSHAMNVLYLGSDCGEADPRKGSQPLHCDAGVRLPDQDGPLPGDDDHERWRSQVLLRLSEQP